MTNTAGGLRARIMATVISGGTSLVGALILLGGQERFSSPSFALARQVAPWWCWGAILVTSGILATIGALGQQMWTARIGHSVASVAYTFLVINFVKTTIPLPNVALTGIGVYSAMALLHMLSAATADVVRRE